MRSLPRLLTLSIAVLVSSLTTACGEGDIETNLPTSSTSTTTKPTTTMVRRVVTTTTSTTLPSIDSARAEQLRVSTVGIGEITWGMKQLAAEQEYGALFTGTVNDPSCYTVTPTDGIDGIMFTISNTRVERVDISVPGITTKSGAGVGWTESEIRVEFGDNIEERPIAGGTELIFVPNDRRDADYRIIFVSDGVRIVSLRAGKLPEVDPLTACAAP